MSKIFKVFKGEPIILEHLRYPLWVSAKLNGVRGYVRNGVVYSTSNKPLPNKNLQAKFGKCEWLDGEFIVGDPTDTKFSLGRTTSIVMSDDKGCDDVKFYVFDHTQYLDKPFRDRTVILKANLGLANYKDVHLVPHDVVYDEKELMIKEAEYLKIGFEGLITDDPNATYKCGKSTAVQAWRGKMKRFKDAEATVVGFEERMKNTNEKVINELGRGKRSSAKAGKVGRGDLGALVLRMPSGVVFSCGTGFSDVQRAEIWNNRPNYLGKLAKYKFLEVMSDSAPISSVFLDFRDPRDL